MYGGLMEITLGEHQTSVLGDIKNGSILRGGVGSGKSRTALAHYFINECGGSIRINGEGTLKEFERPRDLLVFTTAKKRDDLDWEVEAARFGISTDASIGFGGVKIKVDSWNNITNYTDVKDHFIIFDEQRLVGSGAWVKAFLKMAKNNRWIMLSATPGDVWMDFVPVFIANGFYKNRTEFLRRHVVYNQYSKFPKIDRFVEEGHLKRLSKRIIVEMPFIRHTRRHIKIVPVAHDEALFSRVFKDRWNVYKDQPIREVGELFQLMRKVVNSDESRTDSIITLQAQHPRLIIFYNFNYELMKLRELAESLGLTYGEWNGHKHEPVPDTPSWLYLVQYTAGAEAWECITTDAIAFYSLNYSYKINEQARGRTDRMNTPYVDLYYYVLRSKSWIDMAIWKAILFKRNFNESIYKL